MENEIKFKLRRKLPRESFGKKNLTDERTIKESEMKRRIAEKLSLKDNFE